MKIEEIVARRNTLLNTVTKEDIDFVLDNPKLPELLDKEVGIKFANTIDPAWEWSPFDLALICAGFEAGMMFTIGELEGKNEENL